MLKSVFTGAAMAFAVALSAVAQDSAATQKDPYGYLEEIEGAKAIAWAKKENARSLPVLEADPRFADMRKEALAILTSTERLPLGSIHNGAVYNFWQDEAHVRGLWRRASVESFKSGAPQWETVLDFDKLAEDEKENWVHGDIVCLSPEYRRCMIEMSYGGKDAAVWREFDVETRAFVEDGFYLPEAKTNVDWLDADTLLVATDLGEGSLTTSGYPRKIVKLVRSADLAEAPTLFEGGEDDVWVWPSVDHEGGKAHVFVDKRVSFFESERSYGLDGENLQRLPLPLNADFQGVLGGRAIFFLREPWSHQDKDYSLGSIVAYDLKSGAAELVMAAAENQSIEGIGVGETGLIVSYLEDVSGKAARLSRKKNGSWTVKEIALPTNGVVKLASAGGGTDDAMLTFESLTTPQSLFYIGANGKTAKIASMPEFYDAAGVVVEQRFATSADGTKIPYFIMGKESVLKEGNAPTVQYAYGGFLSATLPVYYEDPSRPQHGALAGKMWVSRGGVLVLSNIRGGSEYGPKWHQAALKENRQRAFDDFFAISKDLIASGVTSPEKLGAIGRSNGGLLMGVVMTQHPELYSAIVNGVPLFDMKRYTHLGAGASWIGEYGDPEKPEEWAYISKYSPQQNLEAGKAYPKIFLYTSTQDDRVHPGHARKAGAKLRDLGYDFFYYENMEGGHGGTANQDQLAYRIALEYAYFARMLMGAP